MSWRKLMIAGACIALGTACSRKPHYPGPLTPEQSIGTFHFADSFRAALYAAEPLVADPVSMVFDEHGQAYVVEMADANMPEDQKGRGRIVVLKDRDQDGRADTSVVFADGLKEATTVLPWKGGLIATAAPDILYLKDTTGDDKADVREVLYSGFFADNDEAQITGLRFSVDNWIYANNDGEPGEVSSHRTPNAPKLSMAGADFRFRMDRDAFERTTGPGQFGQAVDDWGHRFFTKNSLHIQQVVIPWRYLHRNPYLPVSALAAITNISDHDPIMFQLTPAPYWRQVRTERRNKAFEARHLPPTEYAKGHFTGASGGTFYGGDGFPPAYYGSIFTGDVSGNLVHRDVLVPAAGKDPYYTARRGNAETRQEFLAATDSWFRPTSFAVGPDGYLYVVDMYRQHIETPVSIPDDLKADMDFSAGSHYGRIYRIVPDQAGTYQAPVVHLADQSSAELVKLLAHPNRWWRLHAHKLLIERQDKTIIPAVKALFAQSDDPRVRMQALYVLDGLDALDARLVRQAMQDSAPEIRENAAMLCERYPDCLTQLEKLVKDSSVRVAFQATLSLGQFKAPGVTSVLAEVIRSHGDNAWFRAAVLSADSTLPLPLLKDLAAQGSFFAQTASWKPTFLQQAAYVIGARNQPQEVASLLDLVLASPMNAHKAWQSACLEGLSNGAQKADTALKSPLARIRGDSSQDIKQKVQQMKQLFSHL